MEKEKKSIVIFEGPDSTGKTSIAKAFVKKHPEFQYFKVKKEKQYVAKLKPKAIQEMHEHELRFFYEMASQIDFNVIMDRSYPSEYVYGKLFRKIDENFILQQDKKFGKLGVKIVILTKPDAMLSDNLFNRKQLVQVKEGYIQFAKKTRCKLLVMDTSDRNIDSQLAKLEGFIYKSQK